FYTIEQVYDIIIDVYREIFPYTEIVYLENFVSNVKNIKTSSGFISNISFLISKTVKNIIISNFGRSEHLFVSPVLNRNNFSTTPLFRYDSNIIKMHNVPYILNLDGYSSENYGYVSGLKDYDYFMTD